MPSTSVGSIPGPETWFVDEGSVRFSAPVTPDVVEWWDRTFVTPYALTPKEMAEIASRNLPGLEDFEFYGLSPEEGIVRFGMTGEKLPNFETAISWMVGACVRMNAEPRLVHNDGSYLHHSLQGRKIGTQWIANLYVLAQRLGVRVIGLKAKEAGPYVWSTFGFSPLDRDWAEIVPMVEDRLRTFRGVVGEKVFAEVMQALASSDPRRIWDIADRQELVMTAPVDSAALPVRDTLGVALLAHSALSWCGHLDLDDPAAFARLQSRIERFLP